MGGNHKVGFSEWVRLREMALGSLSRVGKHSKLRVYDPSQKSNDDDLTNFHGPDKKMWSSDITPKMHEKLKMLLRRLGDVDIHVVLGTPPVWHYTETDAEKYKKLKDFFFDDGDSYSGKLGFRVPKKDIVYIKANSFADPLTPWMLMHSLAHTLFDERGLGNFSHMIKDKLSSARGQVGVHADEKVLYIFFPMGSLRKSIRQTATGNYEKLLSGRPITPAELIREMFVYFLSQGGKIPIPPDAIEKMSQMGVAGADAQRIIQQVKDTESYFSQLLEACRGEVLYDYRDYD